MASSFVRCLLLLAVLSGCAIVRPLPEHFGSDPVEPHTVPGEPELEERMARLVDETRRAHGLSGLERDEVLVALARLHSHDMIDTGFVDHVSPVTGRLEDRLRRAGYLARVSLENIAVYGTVAGAHEGLMDSHGHRVNILSDEVSAMGIGIVRDEAGDLFVTQIFADPAALEDPAGVREAFLDLVNAARRQSGQGPLAVHPELQAVTGSMIDEFSIHVAKEAVGRVGQKSVKIVAEDASLGGVAVFVQTAFGAADLRVPAAALDADAVAMAVSVRRSSASCGQPALLILGIIGY